MLSFADYKNVKQAYLDSIWTSQSLLLISGAATLHDTDSLYDNPQSLTGTLSRSVSRPVPPSSKCYEQWLSDVSLFSQKVHVVVPVLF